MSDKLTSLINELHGLIYKMYEDLEDRDKLVDWLTFISCPRTEEFCIPSFLQDKLYTFPIQRMIDLIDDIKAKVESDDKA